MLIVGISGASGSGKSTFTDAFAGEMTKRTGRAPVIFAADRYFKKELPKMVSPADGSENFDWNSPDSFDSDAMINDIKECAAALGDNDMIIVEGVTIFCVPALREMFDVKVFIDASIEMRIFRRINRNVVTKGQTIEFIGNYYLRFARYREKEYCLPSAEYADIHVDNEYGFDISEAADRILAVCGGKK